MLNTKNKILKFPINKISNMMNMKKYNMVKQI